MLAALHRGINGMIKAFVLGQFFLDPSRLANLHHPDAGLADLLLVVYGFPVYLYLNFSGYTDLVIAAARLAGFRTLPENFDRPYLAANTRDFWTRWHMSFGTWVRHYVFTPLSTRLVKLAPPALHPAAMIAVAIVVFLIVGGWHGTTSNYFLFGLTQAAGVIASTAFESWRRRRMGRAAARAFAERPWFRALSIFITFNYTCLCLLLLNGTPDDLSAAFNAFFAEAP
jgi:D-alanyl-lipoteichoic acid acyltransferase DltB (MBOAT superfamily)